MLIPILTLGILGLLFGIGLGLAFKVFKLEEDPRVGKILEFLPGANCGACGYAGCFGLAQAIAEGKALPSTCAPASIEERKKIAEIIGKELEEKTKLVATLICNGGCIAVDKFIYQGINSCMAANLLFGGQKTCPYGCLGFGDCVNVCPFGAMYMDEKTNLPVIIEEKCTACGLCIKACPKNILTLRPIKNKVYVMCNSTDKGALVTKYCKNGCIGCFKCEKVCPSDAIHVKNNLAKVDYEKCTLCGECVKVCPTKVIHPLSSTPGVEE
ncbi:MAG: RnfABCDGE type electron transport complex subunit B [Candidatus Omnitrophica bacterium]|nr:RnfABCDGE type electron transport complex subunit B [Candidatus Omnitrophota bacterium]MCM8793654.1 RnfABCDGE type electron transport complex subunit B [Candidatus Omnitrophota bacterium]